MCSSTLCLNPNSIIFVGNHGHKESGKIQSFMPHCCAFSPHCTSKFSIHSVNPPSKKTNISWTHQNLLSYITNAFLVICGSSFIIHLDSMCFYTSSDRGQTFSISFMWGNNLFLIAEVLLFRTLILFYIMPQPLHWLPMQHRPSMYPKLQISSLIFIKCLPISLIHTHPGHVEESHHNGNMIMIVSHTTWCEVTWCKYAIFWRMCEFFCECEETGVTCMLGFNTARDWTYGAYIKVMWVLYDFAFTPFVICSTLNIIKNAWSLLL